MIKELIIILFILLVIALVAAYYIKALSKDVEEEEEKPKYSLENLIEIVQAAFSNRLKENLKELNLSKSQLLSERRKKIELRKNIETAYGDPAAKRYIKDAIKTILQDNLVGIDASTINIPIPFNQPDALTMRQKSDIVLHIYQKNYGEAGFDRMMQDYSLAAPKKVTVLEEYQGKLKYIVTKEEMNNVFSDQIAKYPLSFDDKFEILAQYIFAQTYGLGVIDNLIPFYLDEIEGGSGGVQQGQIERANIGEGFHYSYEDVRVIYKGNKYRLEYLSFGSQAELIRTCKNIYKYESKHALTQSNAKIVETMKDGSRITVSRPPISGWNFFLRKFNSVSFNPTFEELYGQKNWQLPETIVKYAVHTQKSLVITGAMSVGKSTLLRVIVGYIPSEKAIRTLEGSAELNLASYYPSRNICAFVANESTSENELYDFVKKTSSDVNIVGESADMEECMVAIRSTQSGSEMAIITDHSVNTDAFMNTYSDALMTVGGYTDKLSAEQVVVEGFKFNIHLSNYNGMRYIDKITEIVPSMTRLYPSDKAEFMPEYKNVKPAGPEDQLEYWKRRTDRKAYKCVDIIEFDLNDNSYHMINPISNELKKEMLRKLDGVRREEFLNDMNMLEQTIGR